MLGCAQAMNVTSDRSSQHNTNCHLCLLRQVLEETGYDIEELVQEEDFIELTLDGKRNKLFIVAGLDPNSAQFAPKCKGVSTGGCSPSHCMWTGVCP